MLGGLAGLVLYVVYNQVTRVLGATIEIRNTGGQGCLFVLHLPLRVGKEGEKLGLADRVNQEAVRRGKVKMASRLLEEKHCPAASCQGSQR